MRRAGWISPLDLEHVMVTRLKPRFLFVYPLAVWLVLTANTTARRLSLGIVLALLGEWLRCWANGYVGHVKVNASRKDSQAPKIGRLITAGPYAFVRHPLYLGTFLIAAGFCVAVGNPWLSVVAAGCFLLAYRAKMREEEALLREEYASVYARYHAAVPQWLPLKPRYPDRQGQWSWEGMWASKEFKTVIWVAVGFLVLYFRQELWQEHKPFGGEGGLKHLLLALLLVVLIASDGVFEWLRRMRRSRPPQPKMALRPSSE